MILVQHGLERCARESGERICLLEGGETLSYAEVDALAERFATALREHGVIAGDRVALLHGNSRHYVAALHGVLKAGAVAVPLNPAWRGGDWEEVVGRCDPVLLITEERLASAMAASPLPHRLPCLVPDLDGFVPDPRPSGSMPDDPAVILFTSGSTGAPKGVVLTHRNVVANTFGVLDYLRLTPRDRTLAVLPFHYVYGQSVLATHLWAGASVAIESRTAYPQVILREMARLGVTGLSGVPSTFMVLLQKGDFEGLEMPRLRYLTCAGGHLPDLYVRRLAERFPGVALFLMYGATEAAGRISYLPPEQIERKRGSIGVPIRGVEMRVTAAPGEEGEIEARGETFSPGYWPLAAPQDRLPADGWYRTGDLGYRDADGYFFLTGRASDLIKIAGHRVSGAEIERALYDTGLVAECAVAGRSDDRLGERAEAWVVLARPGVSADEIQARLAEHLPAYKRPSRVHLRESLEKSASGKILKSALR
ncbi:MAG: class I adenylate-forming enzyme family protein [Thermoanaerobaculia bacterium]